MMNRSDDTGHTNYDRGSGSDRGSDYDRGSGSSYDQGSSYGHGSSSNRPVIGLFRSYDDANDAISMLERNGFTRTEISVAARDAAVRDKMSEYNTVGDSAAKGAVGGGVLGGLAGLLAGLGAIAIPGIGPVVAAGTLASTLTATAAGAGIGAAAGGLLGALTEMGIPEEEAEFYAEGVKRGGVLLTVHTNRTSEAQDILRQSNAVDVRGARSQWENEGWQRFDDSTSPDDDYPRF